MSSCLICLQRIISEITLSVKRKRARPGKQTEARFDESTTENNLGKHAKVTASSSEQQRGGYNEAKEVRMSSNAKAVTLEELQKGGGGSFTIKPAVTIAAVGRRRFAYHSCVECRKKTNQNTEGRYGCVQHPTAKTTARYCLRIQLKQEDISMWSTAFHDVAESILGVSVEDFEELNDNQRRTVVWPAIGMQYNMTMRKTVGTMYTNYTVESVCLPCE